MLLQALLLPGLFARAETRLRIRGGTDTRWSIPLDYCTRLVLPVYTQFAEIEIIGRRRGFYPKGQGHLELAICPRGGDSVDTPRRRIFSRGAVSAPSARSEPASSN